MERRTGLAAILALSMMIAACGGGGTEGTSPGPTNDGEGTPFEGIGDAAASVQLLEAGSLTATAEPGQTWVEVDGQRLEFDSTDSEALDCIINDEQLSVIYRNADLSEVRLSGLLLPGGWNLSLTVNDGEASLMNGAPLRSGTFGIEDVSLSYDGSVDIMEAGDVVSQVDVVLAANCSS